MNFYPSQFDRDDGKVTAIRRNDGEWCLRSIRGPAWFWNMQTNSWDIATGSFKLDAPEYGTHLGNALTLLVSLDPV